MGSTVQLTATAKDTNGGTVSGTTFTWSSDDTNVATVDNSGLVSAVATGTATITATAGSISGTASITVTQPVAAVSVSPATASITEGGTQQLTATATDSGGATISGATFTYASSDTSVATVDSNGLVTAVKAGSATITATSGGVDGTAAITVTVPTVAVTGTVYAPGGTLASVSHPGLIQRLVASVIPYANAQTAGLSPVSGAHVMVFLINDDGTIKGQVLGSALTNTDGTFSVDIPQGTSFGSNLIIQASATNTPQQVGKTGDNTQNCPVTQADVKDITPAVEYATRTLIARIAANGSTLADYTNNEVRAILKQAITMAQDSGLIGANVEVTITNIAKVEGPQLGKLIDDTKAPGGATAPQGLNGTYNLVGLQSEFGTFNEQHGQELGTATIDATAGTFNVSLNVNSTEMIESCQATQNDACARSFTRSASTKTNSISGTFTVLAGHRIAFEPSDNQGGAIGRFSSGGDMIVIPVEGELIIGFKQATTAPSMDGNFRGAEINASLNPSFNVSSANPSWNVGQDETSSISLSISSGSFSGSSTSSAMQKQISCGPTCPDSEVLKTSSSSDTIGGTLSANSTGTLTVTVPNGPTISGAVAADGGAFALLTSSQSEGSSSMAVGVKTGTGMTNASLSGTYFAGSINFELGSGTTGVVTQGGTITLDGKGNGTASFSGTQMSTNSGCNATGCSDQSSSRVGVSNSVSFTYSVANDGKVTINAGGSPTITGWASADGSVVVLTERSDGTIGSQSGNNTSDRGLDILMK